MRQFSNPARIAGKKAEEIYPYYAGFSRVFAEDALQWATRGQKESLVLDPWNGSGTTTRVASQLGLNSIGFDLNPVMVLVAKAEVLDPAEVPVLQPLAKRIVKGAVRTGAHEEHQPLELFFDSSTSRDIVDLARSIWLHVVATGLPKLGDPMFTWEDIAPLAGTYFVALFNSVRGLLESLATSNPTWLRCPKKSEPRIHAPRKLVLDTFLAEVSRLQHISAGRRNHLFPQPAKLALGDSRAMPLGAASVDAIVTSPPYCTRLDYGRSTMPELLILESIGAASYAEARQELMGAATARKSTPRSGYGSYCDGLLERIRSHPSKASSTYYFQSHLAYFNDLAASMSEIGRVLAPGGRACLVVQDSYYKELHNDLPKVIAEMAEINEISVSGSFEYKKSKSMCGINRASQAYRTRRTPVEVAMLLSKE